MSDHESTSYSAEAVGEETASSAVSRTLEQLARLLGQSLNTSECCIYEFLPERDALVCHAIWGLDLDDEDRQWVGTENHLNRHPRICRVFAEREIVVTHAEDEDEGGLDAQETMAYWGEKSALYCPIVADDDLLGVMELTEHRERRAFSIADLHLVRTLADIASVAIANARASRENEEASRRLEGLLSAGKTLTSSMDFDEVLGAVARTGAETLDVPECLIYEYDETRDAICVRCLFEHGSVVADYDQLNVQMPLDDYPNDRRILTGGAVVQERVADPDMDAATRAEMEKHGEKTSLSAPLLFEGEPVGILVFVETRDRREFSSEEMALARDFAEQAAIAIRNARLYRQVQEQNRRVGALLEASRAIAGSMVLEDVSRAAATHAAEALDATSAYIYAYTADGDHLVWLADYQRQGKTFEEPLGTTYDLADYPVDFHTLTANAVVQHCVDDPDLDEKSRADMLEWGERAMLMVPLAYGGRPVGILEVTEDRRDRRFGDDEIDLVRAVGEMAAGALANAQLYRRMEEQNRQLEALVESSRAITSSLEVERVLDEICRQVAHAIQAPASYLYEYLPEQRAMRWVAQYERDPDRAFENDPVGTIYSLSDFEPNRVAVDERHPVQACDEDDLSDYVLERMREWGDRAWLITPLAVGDEVVGILEVTETDYARRYSEDEMKLAQLMAQQAAAAMRNAQLFRRTQQQNRRVDALLQASKSVSSTMVLEEVLELIAKEAASAVNAPSCYIYEYDLDADAIVWRSQYQVDEAFALTEPVGTAYPLSEYPWDKGVLETGELSHVTAADDDLRPELRASMADWGQQTLLTVPLMVRGTPVGLLELAQTTTPRRFSDGEVQLIVAMGEIAATALRNAQQYRREEWRNERLVHVLEISRAVGSSLNADQVAEGLRAQVGRLFPDHPATVEVHLLQTDDLQGGSVGRGLVSRQVATAHEVGDELAATSLQRLAPVQGAVATGQRLVVPLVHKGLPSGYIDILASGARAFAQDEVELVQLLANQAAAAVDNARLYETIEQQAITDGLTGLYNHRYFYDRLQSEVTRAKRYDYSLSVLMLDLDDFKQFNDTYGHPAGDQVLREVGTILQTQLRQDVDIAARYGGEEFAVILPHTPTTGAESVGRRLSKQVESIQPPTGDAESAPDGAWLAGERVRQSIAERDFPADERGHKAHITASVGVATFPAHAVDLKELVKKADQALYHAKHAGKNRVELFAHE